MVTDVATTQSDEDAEGTGWRLTSGYQEITSSIDIDAPVDEVWAVTTDLDEMVEAIDWVYEADWDGDGEVGVGSVYVERAKPGLREGTYRWEVTAHDPPNRTVHSHRSGEIAADLEVRLEAVDESTTRYTQTLRFRALPAFRPLGFVLERTLMKRGMQRDFDRMILPNFKALVEDRA